MLITHGTQQTHITLQRVILITFEHLHRKFMKDIGNIVY